MNNNLQALLQICSVFGICLQTPKCCGRYGTRMFRVYVTMLMAVIVLSSILGIIKSKLLNEFIISWAVSTIVFVSQMATHFIIMYETLTKYQEHADFLRILQDIDVNFKILLKMEIRISAIINEILPSLFATFLISKIGLIFFALNFLFVSDAGYFWWALLAILAIRFRFIQIIVYVKILKFYVMALNKKLSQVVCLKTQESKQLLDIDYKHLHSIEMIKSIKHVYTSLYEASTLVNELAQASMFAGSVSNFLDFTCHIYWTLLVLDNLLSPFNIIFSISTIFPLALLIIKFCYTCQVIKDECQRTALLLSRLLSSGNCSAVTRAYKGLLHDFCMQLMHQRMIFTGSHFFTFDLKFIFAICALIGTHLIILIQFTKNDTNQYENKTIMGAA